MSIALAATWLPRGELARFQRLLPQMQGIYDYIVITLPPDVDEAVKKAVETMPGIQLELMPRLGHGRYTTLKKALETPAEYIQYADMDRLLRWLELRPDELRQTVEAVKRADYLLIGRTEQAFATHPQALQQTEKMIDAVFSHLLGGDFDFCAGSKGFSRRAAEFVIANGSEDFGLGTDTEWSVLVHRGGFSLESIRVDGLDWETADRFRDVAADEETQRQAAKAYDEDVNHWQARVELAQKIIEVGLNTLKYEPLRSG